MKKNAMHSWKKIAWIAIGTMTLLALVFALKSPLPPNTKSNASDTVTTVPTLSESGNAAADRVPQEVCLTICGKTTQYDERGRSYVVKEEVYDPVRNQVISTAYYKNGKVTYRKIYRCDSDGYPVEHTEYIYGTGISPDDTEEYTRVYTYDDLGRLTAVTRQETDGREVVIKTCQYDDAGRLVAQSEYHQDGVIRSTESYVYEENGNYVLTSASYVNGKLSSKYMKSFRADGSPLALTSMNATGYVTGTVQYDYDSNGQLVLYVNRDSMGAIIQKEEYTYDDRGNLIRNAKYDTSYDKTGGLTSLIEYTYDDSGNKICYECWSINAVKTEINSQYEYQYDQAGNVILEAEYSDGVLEHVWQYRYNEEGKLTFESLADGEGRLFWSATFEYDLQGNLSKETRFGGDGNIIEQTVHENYQQICFCIGSNP